MKKIFSIIFLVCSAPIATAMQSEQWLLLVKVPEEHANKAEALAKIDTEARESLKERYVRGAELAGMWQLVVNSSKNEIDELLKDRTWSKDKIACPNFSIPLH